MPIKLKRAYDEVEPGDGYRVLVDRLWPRGKNKEELQLDEWLKEIAPSTPLRKRFNHRPERFGEFRTLYLQELREKDPALVEKLRHIGNDATLTLVYGAKDREHNHAQVLREWLLVE